MFFIFLEPGGKEPLFVFSALNSKAVSQHCGQPCTTAVQRKLVSEKEDARQGAQTSALRREAFQV